MQLYFLLNRERRHQSILLYAVADPALAASVIAYNMITIMACICVVAVGDEVYCTGPNG